MPKTPAATPYLNPINPALTPNQPQRQNPHPARAHNLQPRHDRRLPPSDPKRRRGRAAHGLRPHGRGILPPGRVQVRRLRAVQAAVHQLLWLRGREQQPHRHLPRLGRDGRVLRRHRAVPARGDADTARFGADVCERADQRVWQDCAAGGARGLLLGVWPDSISNVL